MEHSQSVIPPIQPARSAVGLPVHMNRLKQAVNLLLSPAERPSGAWRSDVVAALRTFMDADQAVMFMWRRSAPDYYADALPGKVITEYLTDFAQLDQGMARREKLGLTLWSRSRLWDRHALIRSEYYQEFALRHDIKGTAAHVRVALLYGGAPLPPDRVDTMLRRLDLLLPVLRTGFDIHLRYERWLGALLPMLDRIGERLMLFSLTGRELHRNLSMRRTIEEDPDGERLREGAQGVARAVIAYAQANGGETARLLGVEGDSAQQLGTTFGRYRMHGCIVGPDAPDAGAAVLVSVDRPTPELPGAQALRERFKLTVREVQVACLLVQRMTNEEIAGALGISTHTARHHTESVLLKTGVTSRRALHSMLRGD
jgi:DNA-binding CsgD family transcriptional regulator